MFAQHDFVDKDLSRFVTKNGLKFIINQKKIRMSTKNIKIKTPMLISNLCDFSDAYIVVKGDIAVAKNTDCQ